MLLRICHYNQRVVAETDQTVDLLESHHFVAAYSAERRDSISNKHARMIANHERE